MRKQIRLALLLFVSFCISFFAVFSLNAIFLLRAQDTQKPKDALQLQTFNPYLTPANRPVLTPTPKSKPIQAISTGQYTAPSSNKCTKYAKAIARLPGKKNYGDPNCTFSKDKLYKLLKQQDARFADLWFLTIVPGESSYNPNAFAAPVGVQKKLDASGAWGLYQMGSSKPPGSPPPAPGKNGRLD